MVFVVLALVIPAILALVALSAFILMWAWNTFVPLVWHAAPILTFWQGLALSAILTTIKGIFTFTVDRKEKD